MLQSIDDFITILRLMMHEEVHHIYVLEENVPIGVISFVDVLKYIYDHLIWLSDE